MDHITHSKIVIDEKALKERIEALGRQITADFKGRELVLVGVMKGSMHFLSDLSRAIDLPMLIDMISIGIYANAAARLSDSRVGPVRSGAVRITKDLDYDIAGRHVLIVEDIIRSGLTTGYLLQNLETRGASTIRICTLLQSPEEQLINIPLSYVGFRVSKARLVGYGMDVDEKGRNLPYIAEI
jgi:hypoxanthine phosphoribosyltransferase